MSQKSQDLPLSFPFSDILGEDLEQELFQEVGSQDMNAILNSDLSGEGTGDDIHDNENSVYDENAGSMEDTKNIPFECDKESPLLPVLAANVLSNDEYVGPYGFEASVLPVYESRNPWEYSVELNKVYLGMSQQLPVDFVVNNRPAKQLFIRTTPQYAAQHHASDPVYRCIQHDFHMDVTNKGVAPHVIQHVIRCGNTFSHYIGNSKQKERLSIVFPLSVPQVGSESVREFFHFVCKSSCPSPGMNRREIEVIFTLEDGEGTVLGRKCVKVRICACPKRDKEKEEKDRNKEKMPRGKRRKVEPPTPVNNPARTATQPDDFKVYELSLKFTGKENLVKILNHAEIVYQAKAFELQGHSQEHLIRNNLTNIQEVKKQLTSTAESSGS